MAPPTVPGVPAQVSSPARPRLTVHRTSRPRVTAASARTRVSSRSSMAPPCGLMTSPLTPRSLTSTFDPAPSSVTGTPAAWAIVSASTISAALTVASSHSAGPPTPKVV